jgi:hypothetical protein
MRTESRGPEEEGTLFRCSCREDPRYKLSMGPLLGSPIAEEPLHPAVSEDLELANSLKSKTFHFLQGRA